ncbi:MAG: hypothetical protein ACHQJ6_02935 [Candidatus Berkiellales bacterium]
MTLHDKMLANIPQNWTTLEKTLYKEILQYIIDGKPHGKSRFTVYGSDVGIPSLAVDAKKSLLEKLKEFNVDDINEEQAKRWAEVHDELSSPSFTKKRSTALVYSEGWQKGEKPRTEQRRNLAGERRRSLKVEEKRNPEVQERKNPEVDKFNAFVIAKLEERRDKLADKVDKKKKIGGAYRADRLTAINALITLVQNEQQKLKTNEIVSIIKMINTLDEDSRKKLKFRGSGDKYDSKFAKTFDEIKKRERDVRYSPTGSRVFAGGGGEALVFDDVRDYNRNYLNFLVRRRDSLQKRAYQEKEKGPGQTDQYLKMLAFMNELIKAAHKMYENDEQIKYSDIEPAAIEVCGKPKNVKKVLGESLNFLLGYLETNNEFEKVGKGYRK